MLVYTGFVGPLWGLRAPGFLRSVDVGRAPQQLGIYGGHVFVFEGGAAYEPKPPFQPAVVVRFLLPGHCLVTSILDVTSGSS